MNIADTIFIISFIIMIGITLAKVMNMISSNTLYDWKISVGLLIAYLFSWFLGLQSVLSNPTQTYYLGLWDMAGLLLIANFFIFVIELFLLLSQLAGKPTEAYYSNRQ